MCGRFAQYSAPEKIAEFFGVLRNWFVETAGSPKAVFSPRFNIAPAASVAVVSAGRVPARERTLSPMRWGFSAPPNRVPVPVFNARAETSETLPMFADAVRFSRCIVPADGFFEWRREGRARIPFYFSRADGRPLALGAIARREQRVRENRVCILTTSANALMSGIHHRMPVVLEEENFSAWLSGEPLPRSIFSAMTVPAAEEILTAHMVSPAVNSASAEDSPCLIAPASFPRDERGLLGDFLTA